MAKKTYTYEFIKSYIESAGYVFLISEEEYTNVGMTLKLRCSKGHTYTSNWTHFYHNGFRCKKCVALGINFVRDQFEEEGYTVLSEDYKNQYTKIRYRCSRGHENYTTWNNWQQNSRCPECRKEPYGDIVEAFEKSGYKVLSPEEDYTLAKFKFEYECPKGHIFSMNWPNFKYGYRCPSCSVGNISKMSQEWLDSLSVKKEFREHRINLNGSFLRVDGFDPKTNTVYEFLGDYWHGNPKKYSPKGINSHSKKPFGKLHREWLERKNLLKEAGFKVIYIWESDYILNTTL